MASTRRKTCLCGYDALDRLTSSTVTNGTGAHPVTYQYDANGLGNLTHKSDISTLPSASLTYSTTARPHAVTSLNTGSATRNFTYNANGSMLTGQVDSAARTLTWTSDELPATVTIGSISRTFSYGADRQRYKQVWVSAAGTRTYTYAGEHYVKEVQGSATEHKLYLYANGEQIGYVSDDGTPETRYFHKDHLGSITTIVTNQSWSGREKLSYDAWGKRRSATDWWSAASAASEERGYTGHEHLDDVTLIHMNGRLLDPKLGRVISADPTVPAPLYSQSYNRYSYVFNNPLKYTDPSGFGPWCDVLFPCGLFRTLGDHMTPCPLGSCGHGLGGVDSGYVAPMSQEYQDAWLAAFFAWQNEPVEQSASVLAVKGPADSARNTDQGGTPPLLQRAAVFAGDLVVPLTTSAIQGSTDGSASDNVIGFLQGAWNTGANFANSLQTSPVDMVVGVVGMNLRPSLPTFDIASPRLRGAVVAEIAITVGSLGYSAEGKVAGVFRSTSSRLTGLLKSFGRKTVGAEARALVSYYPPNQGFAGASGRATLVPGSIVDRYGEAGGSFLSPQGTPAFARSLSYGAETRPLNAYEVVRPIEVDAGEATAWFGQPGGGIQYDLGTRTVQDLIDSGHLRELQ